ncbi:MAG: hypothetical protein ACR2PS_06405 [Pseudomonadales bacterium]
MPHVSKPPVLLEHLFDDPGMVVEILRQNAPYTPLGGWFRPDQGQGEAMSPMWFQEDWLHADYAAPGADLFMSRERVVQAAKDFYDAEVVVPHTLYVNLFAAIAESGPAHTDNPVFRGRNRSNTPMLLLRAMYWSSLFEDWEITQATSIWWLNDVADGGGLRYWPDGPDHAPKRHVGHMANTALVGDNHGMFHQVEPVGPYDKGTLMVNAKAELAPAKNNSDDWSVTHNGEESFRAPFSHFRVSVLWKADIYESAEEQQRVAADLLSLEEVVRIFNEDLNHKGADLRLAAATLDDPALPQQLAQYYPEPVPIDAGVSFFETSH